MIDDPHDEELSVHEVAQRIRIIYDLARDLAGEFYDKDRSEKFRNNWPSQDEYAKASWKSFVEEARAKLVAQLNDPHKSVREKNIIWSAIVLERKIAQGGESDTRIQIRKDSQQFIGDKFENKKILQDFGTNRNFRAWLRTSAARMTKH